MPSADQVQLHGRLAGIELTNINSEFKLDFQSSTSSVSTFFASLQYASHIVVSFGNGASGRMKGAVLMGFK